MRPEDTHGLVVDFGRHRGTPYTRLPVSYLRWMVNCGHTRANVARAELQRRGSTLPDLELSGHAIDRASQHCLDIWRKTRLKPEGAAPEGLHAWLGRVAAEALESGKPDAQGRIAHGGLQLVFERDGEWPVVKTVMRSDP